MTGCIQENDLASKRWRFLVGDPHLVGADVLRDSSCLAFRHIGQANRVEQRGFAVIDVPHDRNHGRTNSSFRSSLFAGRSRIDFLRCLLFERDHIRVCTEESRHFTGQLRIECLVNRGEHAFHQKPRNQILRSNIQLFREIFYADAFRDRDAARNRLGLIRHHHARWRRIALHRAFFHSPWNVALPRASRRSTWTAARPRRSRRWKSRAYTQRTCARRCLPRGMHRPPFAGTQWRTRRTSALNRRTSLKNWLARNRTPRSSTHRATNRNSRLHRRREPDALALCKPVADLFVERSSAARVVAAEPLALPLLEALAERSRKPPEAQAQ